MTMKIKSHKTVKCCWNTFLQFIVI